MYKSTNETICTHFVEKKITIVIFQNTGARMKFDSCRITNGFRKIKKMQNQHIFSQQKKNNFEKGL